MSKTDHTCDSRLVSLRALACFPTWAVTSKLTVHHCVYGFYLLIWFQLIHQICLAHWWITILLSRLLDITVGDRCQFRNIRQVILGIKSSNSKTKEFFRQDMMLDNMLFFADTSQRLAKMYGLQAKDIHGVSNLLWLFWSNLLIKWLLFKFAYEYGWNLFCFVVLVMMSFRYLWERKLGVSKKYYSCKAELLKIRVTTSICVFSNLGQTPDGATMLSPLRSISMSDYPSCCNGSYKALLWDTVPVGLIL